MNLDSSYKNGSKSATLYIWCEPVETESPIPEERKEKGYLIKYDKKTYRRDSKYYSFPKWALQVWKEWVLTLPPSCPSGVHPSKASSANALSSVTANSDLHHRHHPHNQVLLALESLSRQRNKKSKVRKMPYSGSVRHWQVILLYDLPFKTASPGCLLLL